MLRRMCLQFVRTSHNFSLWLVDVLCLNRTEIVARSYGNRKVSADFNWKCDVRKEFLQFLSEPLRSPYDHRLMFSPHINIYDRAVTTQSSQGLDTMLLTTCLRATVSCCLKKIVKWQSITTRTDSPRGPKN